MTTIIGLAFFGGDQVVEDEARAADRRPRLVAVAGAVQQIEDRDTSSCSAS